MVRTPNSTTNQGTLGEVGLAANPYDPVPLVQAGANSIWGTSHGRLTEVTTSVQVPFAWDARKLEPLDQPQPIVVPYLMRLKELYWNTFDRTFSLNVIRRGQVIATVPSGPSNAFNFLYNPGDQAYFITSSFIRLATSWQLAARWEIVSFSTAVDVPAYGQVQPQIQHEPLKLKEESREIENEVQPQLQARPKRKLTERIMSVFKRGQS